jgi:hypothetical protein
METTANVVLIAVMFPVTLSVTAYGIQQTIHAVIDSPEEKWRKRYMKSLIRLYRGI